MNIFRLYILLLTVISASLCACERFLAIPSPKNEITASLVFEDDGMARSAVSGMYAQIMGGNGALSGGSGSLTTLCGLYADELENYTSGGDLDAFFTNVLRSTTGSVMTGFWREFYQIINNANSAIEGLNQSKELSPALKKQLLGEALFIRALSYFYLTNLFGDVPLATTSDYRINSTLTRSSPTWVYDQIISDLKQAERLLNAEVVLPAQRVYPSKWAAVALLSRVYLYTGQFTEAAQKATEVINQKDHFTLTENLAQTFKNTSRETIWQLRPVLAGQNTPEAVQFIPVSTPTRIISAGLYNSFEAADKRKTAWIGNFLVSGKPFPYPFKYQIKASTPLQECYIVIRLSELYLIRAEALVKKGEVANGRADLNLIRNKAGLAAVISDHTQTLLDAIAEEKRHELFAELGHRFFDIKRTGSVDAILSKVKPQWAPYATLFPVPEVELTNNPNLKQNEGYN